MRFVDLWKFFFVVVCFCACMFLLSCSTKEPPIQNPTKSSVPEHPKSPKSLESKLHTLQLFDEEGEVFLTLQQQQNGILLVTTADGTSIPWASCADDIKYKITCPQNQNTAVVYVRNCDASADFATRIDILSQEQTAGQDDANTVFVIRGAQSIEPVWQSPNKLVIHYPQAEKDIIFKQQASHGEIDIECIQANKKAEETLYNEIGVFNYGLTGIGAGFSEEALLRMAGYTQTRLGMTRQAWGNWYGDPPYGDDPRGQYLIKQGVIKFRQIEREEIEKSNDNNRIINNRK